MRKRILAYRIMMDALLNELEEGKKETDLEKLKREHLIQIGFFQHERLIHLIVTVLFAILEFLSLLLCMLFPNIGTLLLTVAVLVLLIPYIRHYYLLENETQKMYVQYDRMEALLKNNKTCHISENVIK
ncbi:MAG: hypothetical protein IKP88_09435 [Lachnospiraceae bacterium]|nr:hypothetical protein [Lachnospiraceae bacterium]